jgi:decaprenyl-phosphate phosphoribosyltransferase
MSIQKTIKQYLLLLRPHQWLKNLLLFFPPFFGEKILEPGVLHLLGPSFLSFSFAASCCYIVNDVVDRESDRHHPDKKNRALASGDISLTMAFVLAGFLYVLSIFTSATVSTRFEGFIILYILLTTGYTLYFKNIVILDIMAISLGFFIRVQAGGEAFHIVITPWLYLTVFLVAFFLATGKRLSELIILGVSAKHHRLSLHRYSPAFLEALLWLSAASALITYVLYIVENRRVMVYTVPLAAFGFVRFISIVKKGRGDPTDALVKDPQIMAMGILWAGMLGLILYK